MRLIAGGGSGIGGDRSIVGLSCCSEAFNGHSQ
jgi:hypothetical protein